ncbi:MAG TPA: ornithine cyclodeaminase [Rhabdochlamydiaceae bacterium]|nr:ornithine cyclodeaminase [Rhabdochlamydiaceae bacterium]
MVRIITVDDLRNLVKKVTLKTFMLKLIDRLDQDYSRWKEFDKSPRHATHYPHGVIELMPISDKEYYSFKLVNGHPDNPRQNHLTVVAIGMLADVASGYPVLISEMTLLTAIRTAATSALASRYMARKNVKSFGIIGTGAQSEFQTLSHHFSLGIDTIYYFDIDPKAMQKFAKNLDRFGLKLHPCKTAQSVVEQSDIITTATAEKGRQKVVLGSWVRPGCHINGIGGDCPGKTELDPDLVKKSKVVVEQIEQSTIEGEIQQLGGKDRVFAELWELVAKKKKGRASDEEITLFDSVGFALEDYSTLRLVHTLAKEYDTGHMLNMVPDVSDPKNLFSLLT